MLERFHHFSLDIFQICRYWNAISAAEMKKYGLKGSYALYLITLSQHPEGVTAAKLAELCDRDKADVSRAVTALSDKGFLEPRAGSAYRANLLLTAAGREAAMGVEQKAITALIRAGEGLNAQQRTVLYQCLDIVADNMHQLCQQGL